MDIVYQGQLGAVVGLSSEQFDTASGQSVADVIQALAQGKDADAARHLLADDGSARTSLFVALDGVHVQDFAMSVDGAKELLLMHPMAGG